MSPDCARLSGEQKVAYAALIGVGVLTFALGAKLCLEWGLAWRCPLFATFSIPCPSCGTTMAYAALAEFEFIKALTYNPLLVMGVFLLPIFFVVSRWPQWMQRNGWTIFLAAVGLNWIYLFLFLPR